MPTNTKTPKNAKQRTEVNDLRTAKTDLSPEETKKVKGGVIAIIAPQSSSSLADGSVRPPSSITDGTSNTLLPYIEKK